MRMEASFVKQQIERLLVSFPEMADDEILRRDAVESETDATKLLSRLIRASKETEAQADGLKAYMGELGERQSRLARRGDAIRKIALDVLDAAGLPNFILPEATLTVRRGQPKVMVLDENAIPQEYTVTKTELNKSAIKEAMLNGTIVPGAELSNSEPFLMIRTK